MEINESMKMTGFEPCEFIDTGDQCEHCDCVPLQLYWRSCDTFSQDGTYYCAQCVVEEAEANDEAMEANE